MAKRKASKAKTAGKPAKKAAKKPARRAAAKPKAAAKKVGRQSAAKPKTKKKAARKPATTHVANRKTATPARRKPATAVRTATRVAATRPKVKAAVPRATTVRQAPLEPVTIPSPPSSLDMTRRGSSVRSGRAAAAESRAEQANLTPSITGGDVDTNVEAAYFSGEEAPGGSNPTPDQDVVEEIGKALGIEYQDAEELQGGDELAARDTHRWELDPASAEDYNERGKD